MQYVFFIVLCYFFLVLFFYFLHLTYYFFQDSTGQCVSILVKLQEKLIYINKVFVCLKDSNLGKRITEFCFQHVGLTAHLYLQEKRNYYYILHLIVPSSIVSAQHNSAGRLDTSVLPGHQQVRYPSHCCAPLFFFFGPEGHCV